MKNKKSQKKLVPLSHSNLTEGENKNAVHDPNVFIACDPDASFKSKRKKRKNYIEK